MLRNFAKAIHDAIRGSDVGLRVGGDEFLTLLPRTTEVFAKRVAERLIETASMTPEQFRPTRFSFGSRPRVQANPARMSFHVLMPS